MGEEFVEESWVCAGTRLSAKDKLMLSFFRFKDGRPQGNAVHFEGKVLKYARAGSLYTIQTCYGEAGAVTLKFGTAKYIGSMQDEEQAAEWQLASRLAETEYGRLKREQAGKRDDPLAKVLLPATRAYRKAVGLEKAHVLARVVEIIVGGRGLDRGE